jgi:hypothetical protein
MADEEALEKMEKGLDPGNGNVRVQMGGEYVLLLLSFPFTPSKIANGNGHRCNFTAVHGEKIGWKAVYPPEHILETADEEVDLILKTLDG